MVGLIGPNGSGKSTMIRMMTGFLKPGSGAVCVDGRSVAAYERNELARRTAVVLQENVLNFDFTVREAVLMGRFPHIGRLARETKHDDELADRAIELVGLRGFSDRFVTQLSGGERQRVAIARALCQQPEIMFLDEPTSHLDIRHQVDILDLLMRLNRTEGLTVLLVLHDLNLASLYCDRLILMSEGRVSATGTPWDVLSEDMIQNVYGAQVKVTKHPFADVPTVHLVRNDVVTGVEKDDGEKNNEQSSQ